MQSLCSQMDFSNLNPEGVCAEVLSRCLNLETDLEKGIPRFEDTRPILDELFISPYSYGLQLISQVYYQGRNDNKIFDPTEQARWCIRNTPTFAPTAKSIKHLRNTLAHKQRVSREMLIRVCRNICDYRNKTNLLTELCDLLLQKLLVFFHLIFDPSIEGVCPTCKRSYDTPAVRNDDLPHIPEGTFRELRDSGYKDTLKMRKVKILEGKHQGQIVTFNSWSGTVVNITTADGRRIVLRIDTRVRPV